MKYSFVFVLCLGTLVLQCTCRPQADISSTIAPPEDTSSPPAEQVNADPETATEVGGTGADTVVFDEAEVPTAGISQQDEDNAEADPVGVTTDLPVGAVEEVQADPTTIAPCTGEDCGSGDVPTAGEGDADPAPSDDDTNITTQAPESS